MLHILERRINLQLLIFYSLFVLPLLLGGIEIYFFLRDTLEKDALQTDRMLARLVALEVEATDAKTRRSPQAMTDRLLVLRRRLAEDGDISIWLLDKGGRPIASVDGQAAPHPDTYSSAPVAGTSWMVFVQRPTASAHTVIISFQNSLFIALVMLIVGASCFWFVAYGWVIGPLTRLAKAVSLIRPDQTTRVTDGPLLEKERGRVDEIGQLISALSTMEDEIHTLFRQSDQESQARLHTLEAIMSSLEDSVLLEDPDGQIVYANRSFYRLVGLPAGSTTTGLTERLYAMLEDPRSYTEALQRAEERSGPQRFDFRVRGFYNRVGQFVQRSRQLRMRLFYVYDLAGQLIGRGKILHDVTQQNDAEQIKRNLLAIISHELRTPLTTMKGYATSLLETDVEMDEALKLEFLQGIVTEGDHMAEIITSLLDMSQLEAGTLKLSPSFGSLEALLDEVLDNPRYQRVELQLEPGFPWLYVDQKRIEVVLHNLLENALRYAGEQARVEIRAHAQAEEQDGRPAGLYLSVIDDGHGIPLEQRERIFESFYQIDSGHRRSSKGVGLGLALCRGIVEAHGGAIWAADRADGKPGATFHIYFPPRLLRPRPVNVED
uniref:histidine kinase n=1 Tax=Thermosporothrix sp. COM3 TaxID=2490863 RepID=A0A455SJS3_9CHLR|nr:hypothetical protein KTC_26010 [Thermosporothrix sp. COM3]